MSWKEKWNFIAPKGVEYEIGEDKLVFYPVSVSSLFVLRDIAAPIARAFAALFQGEHNDVGTVDRTSGDGQINGEFVTEKIVEPVSMELARFRLDQKQHALEDAIQTLFSPTHARTVMRLIMDSQRDIFDRDASEDQKDETAQELLETLNPSQFQELLKGLYEGNKEAFGPLASMVAQSKDLIKAKMRGLQVVEEPMEEEENKKETTG